MLSLFPRCMSPAAVNANSSARDDHSATGNHDNSRSAAAVAYVPMAVPVASAMHHLGRGDVLDRRANTRRRAERDRVGAIHQRTRGHHSCRGSQSQKELTHGHFSLGLFKCRQSRKLCPRVLCYQDELSIPWPVHSSQVHVSGTRVDRSSGRSTASQRPCDQPRAAGRQHHRALHHDDGDNVKGLEQDGSAADDAPAERATVSDVGLTSPIRRRPCRPRHPARRWRRCSRSRR